MPTRARCAPKKHELTFALHPAINAIMLQQEVVKATAKHKVSLIFTEHLKQYS